MIKDRKVLNAIYIGTLCSISYLAVYFARNILSVVTPQMIENGYSEAYIGKVSSVYFIFYAVGQLINGAIGDKIKAKYMISLGLILTGITNTVFPYMVDINQDTALIIYGMTGYFLAMIYGPMTKIVAENTEPIYAIRCGLGYTLASFLGSPLAGVVGAALIWQSVFMTSTAVLVVMGIVFFAICVMLEKKGIVKYNQYDRPKGEGGGIKILIKNRIIRFTLVSVITGVIRTTVVFWFPTYISQYLGFSADKSAMIFTVASFGISASAFVAIFLYERLRRNMDLTLFVSFLASTVFFILTYFIEQPVINVVMLVLAIIGGDSASTMLWSRYCPSLRDTGMVSGATGFLDFMSYMAAAVSSTLFANSVSVIGWGNLILIWAGLMAIGVIISINPKRFKNNKKGYC